MALKETERKLTVDEVTLRQLKTAAALRGITMKELVAELARVAVARAMREQGPLHG